MPARGSGTHSGVPPGFEQSTYTGEHQAPSVPAVALPASQPVAGQAIGLSLIQATDKTAPESVRSPINARLLDSIEEAPSPPAESTFDVFNASDSEEPASVPLTQQLALAEGTRHEQQDVATACGTGQVGLHTRLFGIGGFIQPHTFTCEDEVTPRREAHAHADAGEHAIPETSSLVSASTHAFSPPSNAAQAGSFTADGSASMTSPSTLFGALITTLTPPVLGSAALYDSDDSQSSYGETPANGTPTSRPRSLGRSRAARPEYPPIGWEQDGRTQGEGLEPAQVTNGSAALLVNVPQIVVEGASASSRAIEASRQQDAYATGAEEPRGRAEGADCAQDPTADVPSQGPTAPPGFESVPSHLPVPSVRAEDGRHLATTIQMSSTTAIGSALRTADIQSADEYSGTEVYDPAGALLSPLQLRPATRSTPDHRQSVPPDLETDGPRRRSHRSVADGESLLEHTRQMMIRHIDKLLRDADLAEACAQSRPPVYEHPVVRDSRLQKELDAMSDGQWLSNGLFEQQFGRFRQQQVEQAPYMPSAIHAHHSVRLPDYLVNARSDMVRAGESLGGHFRHRIHPDRAELMAGNVTACREYGSHAVKTSSFLVTGTQAWSHPANRNVDDASAPHHTEYAPPRDRHVDWDQGSSPYAPYLHDRPLALNEESQPHSDVPPTSGSPIYDKEFPALPSPTKTNARERTTQAISPTTPSTPDLTLAPHRAQVQRASSLSGNAAEFIPTTSQASSKVDTAIRQQAQGEILEAVARRQAQLLRDEQRNASASAGAWVNAGRRRYEKPIGAQMQRHSFNDWRCPSCGYHNFARNWACLPCGFPSAQVPDWAYIESPAYAHAPVAAPKHTIALGSPGDWKCECGLWNWRRRDECFYCKVGTRASAVALQRAADIAEHQHSESHVIRSGLISPFAGSGSPRSTGRALPGAEHRVQEHRVELSSSGTKPFFGYHDEAGTLHDRMLTDMFRVPGPSEGPKGEAAAAQEQMLDDGEDADDEDEGTPPPSGRNDRKGKGKALLARH